MLYSTTAIIISFDERLVLIAFVAACILTAVSAWLLARANNKKKGGLIFFIFVIGFMLSLFVFRQLMHFSPLQVELVRIN